MARISEEQAGGKNVLAFLDMLAVSELGQWLIDHSDDGYNVLVGATPPSTVKGVAVPANLLLFQGYSSHPNVLNREANSTAAGRYQLLGRYFKPYADLLRLSDFSPRSQDLIALQQIKERHAFPLIQAGQFALAVKQCSNIWASLPGNSYGQHQHTHDFLATVYKDKGGKIAVS